MTEEEWLVSTDVKVMLPIVKGKSSDRKLRLFACACGRRKLDRLYSQNHRCVVEVMKHYKEIDRRILDLQERYADGEASMEDLVRVYEAAGNDPVDARDAAYFDPYLDAYYIDADFVYSCGTTPAEVQLAQSRLLRDIVGNPFRPFMVDPSEGFCSDKNVVEMAQFIYKHRAFERLRDLADVLGEAGCENVEVLKHCREPGPHVRGCWLVDALLGKS